MKKQTKVLLGALALVVVVVAALFVANPAMLQGKMSPGITENQQSGVALACQSTWTKALSGNYTFVFNQEHTSDRVDISGITASQLQQLANAIDQGCDMKIGFKTAGGTGWKEPQVICDQYFKMGNLTDGLYVGCSTGTPLISNNYAPGNYDFLRDDIALWTMSGTKEVKLSKTRTQHGIDDQYVTSASFFIVQNGEPNGDWQVNIYLKK
jgi:hypothetical protein